MNQPVAVDCTVARNGRVWVRRIKLEEHWHVVEQGRQWQDSEGRHVLIMRGGQPVEELVMSGDSLRWELRRRPQTLQVL